MSLQLDPVHRGTLRLICFFLLVAITAVGLQKTVNSGLRRIPTSEFGAFNRVMSGQVNADIVISGSSRALAHYDPRVLQGLTGNTAYNLGRNGSQTDMQVAVLKAYLNHNAKPKFVIHNLDLFSFVVTHKGELYEPGFYMPYLDEVPIYDALHQIDSDAWKWKHLPLYGYVVEDMRFTWVKGIQGLLGVYPREDYFFGFNPRSKAWSGEFESFRANHPEGVHTAIEPAGVAALEKLVQLCVCQGIQVVLVYSPEYSEMQALELDRPKIMEMFHALANRYGITFWDYSDSAISRQKTLFQNSQHLNSEGAEVFSADLGARLEQLETGRLSADRKPRENPSRQFGLAAYGVRQRRSGHSASDVKFLAYLP